MGALDAQIEAALDNLVPPRPGPEAWKRIVDDAQRADRAGVLVRVVPVALAASVLAVLVLAWPFSNGPTGTVLQRAAGAIGDGPVLHVVTRSGWGGTLVDLKSGTRTQIHGEVEIWYDPQRGVHTISRFGGVTQGDAVYPPGRVKYLDKTLAAFAAGYRAALQNGTARLLGRDVVDGKPVYWIRVDAQMLPESSDNKLHEWAHDVAVSQSDYKPVATRETRDGVPGPDGNTTIVSVESLPAGEGDFERKTPNLNGVAMSERAVGSLSVGEARAVLGRTPLWAGAHVAGLALGRIWKDERREGYDPQTHVWRTTYTGVDFWYGQAGQCPAVFPAGCVQTPFVRIAESLTLDAGFQRGVSNYSPPEGSVLIFGSGIGVMQADGVHIALEASNEDLLLAAARSLAPVPG